MFAQHEGLGIVLETLQLKYIQIIIGPSQGQRKINIFDDKLVFLLVFFIYRTNPDFFSIKKNIFMIFFLSHHKPNCFTKRTAPCRLS